MDRSVKLAEPQMQLSSGQRRASDCDPQPRMNEVICLIVLRQIDWLVR
jgi:hypothetical protein